MEQHQIYAVFGFLFLLWCSNLIAFSQEAAQYNQQGRQRAIQLVASYMSLPFFGSLDNLFAFPTVSESKLKFSDGPEFE